MSIYDLTRDEIAARLSGQPAYRVEQVWSGLYRRFRPVDEITELPAPLRQDLAAKGHSLHMVTESPSDDGETIKWLFGLEGGAEVETVLMHYPARSTVCVSSQAGCAMGCTFCATGQLGFTRHLSAGEIVGQVVMAGRVAAGADRRLSNVVFMGMGEPLANFGPTWAAVERIIGAMGLSARSITISTVGVVPGIDRLTSQGSAVGLALSLHAANDDLRRQLVPLNDRYPIAELVSACRRWAETTGRRLTIEWALIDGVNDRPSDARELSSIAEALGAHVNLIALNPTPGYRVAGTSKAGVTRFADQLGQRGVNATVRRTRGTDIDAACGQLHASRRGAAAEVRLTRHPTDSAGPA